MNPMLEVKDLHVYYGKAHALKGVTLSVGEGEMVALIGNNGAGKTTLLKAISGLVRVASGDIYLKGQPMGKLPADAIVKKGIIHVPEGRRVFPDLTVQENLRLGAYARRRKGDVEQDLERVYSLFPVLKSRFRQAAGTLSGGEQQMLALGRGLMGNPQVLLLDEPSLGLAPVVVESIFATISEIHRQGTTVLLVEQNAFLALSLADRAYVIETGAIVMQGRGKDLLANDQVKRAYLGGL